jgi:hypothetical protein
MKIKELCINCDLLCQRIGHPDLDCITANEDVIPVEEVVPLMKEVVLFQYKEILKQHGLVEVKSNNPLTPTIVKSKSQIEKENIHE